MADNILPDNMPALLPTYARQDVYFERGEGCYLFDDQGQKYLDFVAGIAVCALGHAHPTVVQALTAQAGKLWIMSNYYKSHSAERLAQRLADVSFADTVFFQNSGVEAWELGCKIVRKYFSSIGQPQRYRIITFQGCFHGRTLAAIAAAKTEKMVKGFGPMTDGFDQVAWGNLNELRAAITPETAAIHIEPVQGEGGLRVASHDFMHAIKKVADEFGLLLFFDEIQCGLGRTGKLWAYEWSGITPDVMCIAKALGNGFPIGACLATAKAAQGMTAGTHGTTYGGNPLGTEVAHAVLDAITTQEMLAHVGDVGNYLQQKFKQLMHDFPGVFIEHRGVGLMQGLKTTVPVAELIDALRAEKLLVASTSDHVLRVLQPLIVTRAQIDEAVGIIARVAARYAQKAA